MAEKEWKKLYDENGILLYEGFTVHDMPCGAGEAYYPDGTLYREGIFGIKGLLTGKEYYPNGQLRLNAVFALNKNYGPNYPQYGIFLSEDGTFTHEGIFTYGLNGTGYPIVDSPKELHSVIQSGSPSIPALMWWNEERSTRCEL